MSVKMKARDLGLQDLRYDVEVNGWRQGEGSDLSARWVGTLLMVTGPFEPTGSDQSLVRIMLANGADPVPIVLEADSEVTVDRKTKSSINHFGGA